MTCGASAGMWVVWLDGRHLIVLTMFRVLYAGVYIVRRANYAYTGLTLSRLFLLASQTLPLTLERVMFSSFHTSQSPPPFLSLNLLAATNAAAPTHAMGLGRDQREVCP